MPDATARPVVLVVEDDTSIAQFVAASLSASGLRPVSAGSAAQALAALDQLQGPHTPRLLIIDLGLPDRDGVDLIAALRQTLATPILVLSARLQEAQKIAALDAGADDYLTKPFGVGELLARVRANLRRPRAASADGKPDESLFIFGDVAVDRKARLVRRAGVEVHLTPIEYRLLLVLVANVGRVLTHRQLLREVWGPSHADQSHYLRIYMGHLRQKLETDPSQPQHLLTETAVGYRLV